MLKSDTIKLKQSERRKRLSELSELESLDAPQAEELERLTKEYRDAESQYQAAVIAEAGERGRVSDAAPDAEERERRELRSKARFGHFLAAALTGDPLAGESREYRQSLGLESGIPLAMFDAPREERADTVTPSPNANTGVSLRPVMPAVFARSVMPRLGVAMPMVGSGGYSVPVITTNLSAAAVAKGTAQESTAGAITARATTPHRVSARLTIAIEDVAGFGNDTFESALRQNLMLAMSDRLDLLALNGDGTGANPQGLLAQLTNPDDPTSIADFDSFVALAADGVDGGPWAESMRSIRLLVNAETMRLAEKAFQLPVFLDKGTGTANVSAVGRRGEMSAAAYLRDQTAGFMASARMPATASNIAQAIRYRSGTMGLDGVNAMEAATCPVWGSMSVDDIYSDAASGQRHLTLHALIGDVIVNYADAYTRVDLKVS